MKCSVGIQVYSSPPIAQLTRPQPRFFNYTSLFGVLLMRVLKNHCFVTFLFQLAHDSDGKQKEANQQERVLGLASANFAAWSKRVGIISS